MADERKEILHDILSAAIPVNPTGHGLYVTREEFLATIETIESRIENSSLKQKQWVLSGCVAILISFGGGYISLVAKLDRLADALPLIAEKSDARTPWIQAQERRDAMQDEALKRLDKEYQPMPYSPPPQ